MLLLGRTKGARIRIGDDIWITIVEIGKYSVRVGIDAPRDVTILREELINDENTYPTDPEGERRA